MASNRHLQQSTIGGSSSIGPGASSIRRRGWTHRTARALAAVPAGNRRRRSPRITTDDDADVSTDDELSGWIGRPVGIRSAADGPGTFENPTGIENETDRVQWQSAGPTFHDDRSTISSVSEETLLGWDARRFRIDLIRRGSGENRLGDLVTVRSATLSIRKPIDRCVMVTRAHPGTERRLGALKTIIRERDNRLGMGPNAARGAARPPEPRV